MTSPISIDTSDPGLGLEFERLTISRENHLLHQSGINASIAEGEIFPFNGILASTGLHFISILCDRNGHSQITAYEAYERLQQIKEKTGLVPLCPWAIDQVLGYRTPTNGLPQLPTRPNNGKRLLILNYGRYKSGVDVGSKDGYIYLRERGQEQGFDLCFISHFHTFALYPDPGCDLVALCAPSDSCFSTAG